MHTVWNALVKTFVSRSTDSIMLLHAWDLINLSTFEHFFFAKLEHTELTAYYLISFNTCPNWSFAATAAVTYQGNSLLIPIPFITRLSVLSLLSSPVTTVLYHTELHKIAHLISAILITQSAHSSTVVGFHFAAVWCISIWCSLLSNWLTDWFICTESPNTGTSTVATRAVLLRDF